MSLKELSLFTGIGGGLLASKLLGWQTIAGVEINEYCRRVIKQRQLDGMLDEFPIYENIKLFNGAEFRGKTDVVSGGFPCQAFSSAARGRNNAEDLWPEMFRVIQEVQPKFVFAENVKPAPIAEACRQLNGVGYDCNYTCLSASDVGAPHQRDRYWLVAYANPNSQSRRTLYVETRRGAEASPVEWWHDDTRAMGVHDGLSHRMDRMRALGNAQVPSVARLAWDILKPSGLGL